MYDSMLGWYGCGGWCEASSRTTWPRSSIRSQPSSDSGWDCCCRLASHCLRQKYQMNEITSTTNKMDTNTRLSIRASGIRLPSMVGLVGRTDDDVHDATGGCVDGVWMAVDDEESGVGWRWEEEEGESEGGGVEDVVR